MNEAAAYPPFRAGAVGDRRIARPSFAGLLALATGAAAIAALWLTGHGGLLRVAIPGVALAVGVVLYIERPIRYVEYSLWLWFLTPLIRRLVDWRFGYTDPNFILLAPLLVSGITGLALLRPEAFRGNLRVPACFLLCGAAVLYAAVLDVIQGPSTETVYGLADWLCPLLFGLHFYLNWDRYEEYRAVVAGAFLCGVLVIGVYGLYQFFAPPAWDRYWLESLYEVNGIASSFGKAEPFLVRVWSTMNAPGPFANTMMVGLLLLLVVRSPLKLPAAVAGYPSFLLSTVRTAWLSWLVGLFLILKNANPRVIARVCLSIALLLACVLPLASEPPIAAIVSDRVKTFSEMQQDESFMDREGMYRTLVADVMESPFGYGFKNREDVKGFAVDSGILATLFALGWVGTLVFTLGVAFVCLKLLRQDDKHDPFLLASKAIVIGIVAQVVGGNVFVNVTGMMFWMFAGLCMAAERQNRNQRMVAAESSS